MAAVVPEGGVGDMGGGGGGGDAGGGGTSLDAAGSVDNWLGSTSFSTQAGSHQQEAQLAQSSPVPGCSKGGRYGQSLA